MRKVVLYHLMSLDAVAFEDSDWLPDEGERIVDYLGAVIASQDDVLLGGGTYDYWSGYWPTSDFQPFAGFVNQVRKHVFTSRRGELEPAWDNSVAVAAPAADYVRELKNGPGRDIGVHGSIELARGLLRAELVDELRLVVAPAVVGHGRRVFEGAGALQSYRLRNVAQGERGSLFLDYGR